MNITVVIVTMECDGDLANRAIHSLVNTSSGISEAVVVWNGCERGPSPKGTPVTHVEVKDVLGVAAARNLGAEAAAGELILFLDDDAVMSTHGLAAIARDVFANNRDLGAMGLRIRDPDTGLTARKWIPRFGKSQGPGRVTRFPGGAALIRSTAFGEVGGFEEDFVFGHEETAFGWRLIDAGYDIVYEPTIEVLHSLATDIDPGRTRSLARNRAVLATRFLPWPLVPIHLLTGLLFQLWRSRSLGEAGSVLKGFLEGMSGQGSRRPITWRTVLELSRLGQPPLI